MLDLRLSPRELWKALTFSSSVTARFDTKDKEIKIDEWVGVE